MSEEPLERAEQAIKEGREAAEAAPIMPFDGSGEGPGERSGDGAGGVDAGAAEDPEDPGETGGDVAQHGNDEE
jgi:hypothetical protein